MTVPDQTNESARPTGRPTLWAVGGGKGGVGKSVVCSSLAISIARRGPRCVAIDLDLGAANLHSLLGVPAPRHTLSDFLSRRVGSLEETIAPTPFANLALVSGARAGLDMANPKHSQKEKLLRHVRALDADHVFLDLSAGCAFNALDFFLAADHGLAVVVPERTSIENTQHFLKTAFFRSLRGMAQHEPMRGILRTALASADVRSARDLIRVVAAAHPGHGRALADHAAAFSPTLVVNQLESSAQDRVCTEVALACRHHLASGVRHRGSLPRDARVRDALAEGRHVLALYPGAPFSVAVEALARDLLRGATAQPLSTVPDPREARRTGPPPPPVDGMPPGAYLRSCRERQGLTLADVRQRTRIRSLDSIERERFDELPPERYVAAFVRQYAHTLGITEGERLAERYVERYRAARLAS